MMRRVTNLILSGLLCFIALSSQAAVVHDEFKAMIIDGDSVPQAIGYSIDQLSLAAVKDGLLEPIPFQIDEYNVGGALYFEGWDVPIDGTQGIMDGADKLLFLLKDAGAKRGKQPYDGKFIAEIKVSDESMAERYVYLVSGSRLRSEEQYVRYSSEMARVETDFYELSYDPENHLIWKNFTVPSYRGEEPFDTMKIRLGAGFITSLATVELNNKHLVAEPKGERIGPIRTSTQLELTVWMLELPIFTASLQLHHYSKSLVYDMRVVIPEFRRSLIVNPTASVSLDGNGLIGAKVVTATGPETSLVVDGEMGEQEQALIEKGINANQNWLFTGTNRDLDLISYFDYIGQTEEALSLVLVDDKQIEDKPERFVGQLPQLGYRIENMPTTGLFGLAVSLYMDEKFEGNPAQFSRLLRALPDVEVRGISG
ncbi:MAG: hypothetical protein MI867_18065 [Pseudomonadales bacterium]|nr:hypothetical protein [Pseudomonadales bacterium]